MLSYGSIVGIAAGEEKEEQEETERQRQDRALSKYFSYISVMAMELCAARCS